MRRPPPRNVLESIVRPLSPTAGMVVGFANPYIRHSFTAFAFFLSLPATRACGELYIE